MRAGPPFLAAAIFVALASASARAHATPVELQLMEGPVAFATTWRGDFGVGETLRTGVRFGNVVALDFQGWKSFATVDTRLVTGLSLGITGYLPLEGQHPFFRSFVLRQMEQGLVSAQNAPIEAFFGVGDGIRARTGAGFCLGTEILLRPKAEERLRWVLIPEVSANYFADGVLGPRASVSLTLGLGFNFQANP